LCAAQGGGENSLLSKICDAVFCNALREIDEFLRVRVKARARRSEEAVVFRQFLENRADLFLRLREGALVKLISV
jgi:hypothetical protein